jgi:hypothetical protein
MRIQARRAVARRREPKLFPVAPVPRLWPGSTVVCLGTGPSLTTEDVEAVRGRAKVIAINNAHVLAPWADVLYACDYKWWSWHKGVPGFTGPKYALDPRARVFAGVQVLRKSGQGGIDTDPTSLRTGSNSGYQAIGLAIHFGATRILLLGYDMRGEHFFGKHPDGSAPPFALCLSKFATLVEPLQKLGVTVINCSRKTAIPETVFPRMPLGEALN